MKIGEYFRTPWGDIGKITNIPKHDKYQDDGFYLNSKFVMCGREAMKELKSTPNIIDLIEVGDYVNGYYVNEITDIESALPVLCIMTTNWVALQDIDIKSIVTKEQFESMEYKVGE